MNGNLSLFSCFNHPAYKTAMCHASDGMIFFRGLLIASWRLAVGNGKLAASRKSDVKII